MEIGSSRIAEKQFIANGFALCFQRAKPLVVLRGISGYRGRFIGVQRTFMEVKKLSMRGERKKVMQSNYIKKGRGQGAGENYQPFIQAHDNKIASEGWLTRHKGWKTRHW